MVANEDGDERRQGSSATTGTSKSTRRRSSKFFSMARQSFVKSGGERGASVETLRGRGADFEGMAIVKRGDGDGVSCGCFGTSDTDEVLVLIKGPFLFVFKNETSQSPKYAVPLAHLKATVKEEGHGLSTHGYTSVNLETALGDVEYVVTFHTAGNPVVATTFANVVTVQAATGEADEARKRLGHENIRPKRTSIAYAETIAQKKTKDQPDKPVSRNEIMADMMPTVDGVVIGGPVGGPI